MRRALVGLALCAAGCFDFAALDEVPPPDAPIADAAASRDATTHDAALPTGDAAIAGDGALPPDATAEDAAIAGDAAIPDAAADTATGGDGASDAATGGDAALLADLALAGDGSLAGDLAPTDDAATIGDLLGADLVPVVDAAVPDDLTALPDLSSPDLVPSAPVIASVTVAGARGAPAYEGEGSEAPSADSGVALRVVGANLTPTTVVTSPDGRFVPSSLVYVNAAGTELSTSIALLVDPTTASGTVAYPITLTNAVGGTSSSFTVNALPELVAQGTTLVANATTPLAYSTVEVVATSTLTVGGGTAHNRGYLWVTGLLKLDANANLYGAQDAAGYPGCCKGCGCNAATNGPGFGGAAANGFGGGGGAGYGTYGGSGGGGSNGGGGGVPYGDPSLVGLQGGSGGGSADVTGGNGGGVLRVQAGAISMATGGIHADGAAGAGNSAAAGGGSGGALLVQTGRFVDGGAVSASGGLGGKNIYNGGDGAVGRLRIDVALPPTAMSQPAMYPKPIYGGASLAGDLATAFATPPVSLQIVCGAGFSYSVFVDGVLQSATTACNAAAGTFGRMSVSLTSPLSAGAIHLVCVKNVPVNTSAPAPVYAAELSEQLDCRSLVVASP